VVERDDNINVGLPGGQTVAAKLVGRDPSTDLAVLRADTQNLTPANWADLDSVRVGHLVLAAGRPGNDVLATLGIVSAMEDDWRAPTGGKIERFLQTDVGMFPGFSGGPLLNVDQQVVGLNTSALMRGISLTIPAPTIKRVVEALLAHGRIRRAYLGVGAQPARLPAALEQQTGQETGLLLVTVEPDSPAEKGGLLMGDTILTLEGKPVRHQDDLLGFLSGDRIGQKVKVGIIRGGQTQEVEVEIGERT
jgi:S1-C subfamily serine protease